MWPIIAAVVAGGAWLLTPVGGYPLSTDLTSNMPDATAQTDAAQIRSALAS